MQLRMLNEDKEFDRRAGELRMSPGCERRDDVAQFLRDFVAVCGTSANGSLAQLVYRAEAILAGLDRAEGQELEDGESVIPEMPAVVGNVAKAAAGELAAKGASALVDKALGAGGDSD